MSDAESGAEEDQSVQWRIQGHGAKAEFLTGALIQDVARGLDIHPFMLSRWRKEVREGKIVAKSRKGGIDSERATRQVERAYALLKEEHMLLKKAIRFCSERRRKSSSSWTDTKGSIG
ncbi:MAG: transposase [Chromatiales bacterium]